KIECCEKTENSSMDTDVQWRTSLLVYAEPGRNLARMHLNAMENQEWRDVEEGAMAMGNYHTGFILYSDCGE
ncbi:MAG: hypothetical protein KKG34_03325, partial [Proteobacteria bacterium]|nr:hypothetical protein [Pseudomonadota bacterium]